MMPHVSTMNMTPKIMNTNWIAVIILRVFWLNRVLVSLVAVSFLLNRKSIAKKAMISVMRTKRAIKLTNYIII